MMVENQLTQIADMTKHGVTITDQLFGTVASDIVNLEQIVNTGQALSYTMSNLDGTFRVRFPGYSPTTNYGQAYQTGAKQASIARSEHSRLPGCRTRSSTATRLS